MADEVGSGAHGTVWRAWDARTKGWVAVKAFAGRGGQEGAWRFLREQRVALDHPSIVKVLDYGADSGGAFLVTELFPAGSVEDVLAEQGPVAVDLALRWTAELLDGLAALAATGVVHRDIKPANLMLRGEAEGPRLVIADFGQAWVDDRAELTVTPGPVGTRGYIAPELHAPHAVATAAADLYAAGVTLRRMLSGGGPTVALPEATPQPVVGLVDALTASDPIDRPRPAEAAATARQILASRTAADLAPTGTARTPQRLGRPPDPYRRRKVAVAAAALLTTNAVGAWALTRPDPPAPPEPAAADEIEWRVPFSDSYDAFAVGDDGTTYLADSNLGVIYRVDGADLVPVAGGGSIGTDRGEALDLDLTSAFLDQGPYGPTDVFNPTRWSLAVDGDGTLWLNTGDLWHIDPEGSGERVVTVDGDEDLSPYVVFSTTYQGVDAESVGEATVFDPGHVVESIPSPVVPRAGGADFVDHGAGRIAHVTRDGVFTDVCHFEGERREGPGPTDQLTLLGGGEDRTVDGRLTPSSFAVVEEGDCWVVDAVGGDVVHLVDGEVVSRAHGPAPDSTPRWTDDPTALDRAGIRSGDGRTEILGVLADGRVLAQLTSSIGYAGLLGVFDDEALPTHVFPFVESSAVDQQLGESDARARLRLSADGTTLAGVFTGLLAPDSSDPRTLVDRFALVTFDADTFVDRTAFVLPDDLSEGEPSGLLHTAATRWDDRLRQQVGPSYRDGMRTDEVGVDGFVSPLAMRGGAVLTTYDSFVWEMSAPPEGRLRLATALRPEGGRSADGCGARDLAAHPTRPVVAVVCGTGDTREIVEVDLDGSPDDEPVTLASPDAFADADAVLDEASKDLTEPTFGPHIDVEYRPDGRLVVVSADDSAVFEVIDGELRLLTGFGDEDYDGREESLEAIEAIDHDPVLVRSFFERLVAERRRAGDGVCAGPDEGDGPYTPSATVALDDGELLMALERCIVVVTPGGGSRPLDTGDAPERWITSLARTDDGVLAYSSLTAELWHIPFDGGGAVLVAGRRLATGSSPDGARAVGSPIGGVRAIAVDSDGRPCWVETLSHAVRCVDAEGVLVTATGPSITSASGGTPSFSPPPTDDEADAPEAPDPICRSGDPVPDQVPVEGERLLGGGLSIPLVSGYEPSTGVAGLFTFADEAGAMWQETEDRWVSQYAVGGLSRAAGAAGSTDVADAAEAVMGCLTGSDTFFADFTDRTDLADEPITVDGASGHLIVAEVRVDDPDISVEGDVVQVVVVDTGDPDRYGLLISTVPIDDQPRLDQQAVVLADLRVE